MRKLLLSLITFGKTGIVVLLTIILSVTLSGCLFLPKEEETLAPPLADPPKMEFDTFSATKGTIEKKITAAGTFTSSVNEPIYFKNKAGVFKNIYVNNGDNVKKGQLLAELDTDSLESQIKQEQISVRLAEIDYQEKTSNLTITDLEKERASLILQTEKLKLQDLQNELEKARTYSPINGKVVFLDTTALPGSYINANKEFMTIADGSQLIFQYKGDNSSNFPPGAAVTVKYKDSDYKGQVIMCPSTAPADASKDDQSKVNVKLDKLPEGVSIGDNAVLTYVPERKENAIIIPRAAVTTFDGRNVVNILEKGVQRQRDVELGIQNATEVVIVKGLNEGDKVIQGTK